MSPVTWDDICFWSDFSGSSEIGRLARKRIMLIEDAFETFVPLPIVFDERENKERQSPRS